MIYQVRLRHHIAAALLAPNINAYVIGVLPQMMVSLVLSTSHSIDEQGSHEGPL